MPNYIELTTLPVALDIDIDNDRFYFDDVDEDGGALNQTTLSIIRDVLFNQDVTVLVDDSYDGNIIRGFNNSGGVTQWDAVYLNNASQWVKADADGVATFPARGMAVSTESDGDAVDVLVNGKVRNDDWAWTPGGTIYLSASAGGLTQSAPAVSGDQVQQVGFALTDNIAYFDFDSTYITLL